MRNDRRICVVIPALDEEDAIGHVLAGIPSWVDRVVVADNGSSDGTAAVALGHGATVVHEPRRGYGAACLRALAAAEDADIVVFLDADNSDDPSDMGALVAPLLQPGCGLVIGSRVLGSPEAGALTLVQRFGNALASTLLAWCWKQPCTDLGPFRAIPMDALRALEMDDLDYGWTVQMQARAMKAGLKVVEVPVRYRKRIGRSKISGTIRGVAGAGYKILATIAREALASGRAPHGRKRLLVFTRYPEPGTSKTRMIPALGPEGAAALQRDMTRRILAVVRGWCLKADHAATIHFSGGTAAEMAACFGSGLRYEPQDEGDLGVRLSRAFESAANEGAEAFVAIGADCPDLDERILDEAFLALENHDAVIGPAKDGGYYLIGLRKPNVSVFSGLDWGTEAVFSQTMERFAALGIAPAVLETLDDVDVAADLPVWERHRDQPLPPPCLTVVVPALNEAERLPGTLECVVTAPRVEVIVVDGGSTDNTVAVAEDLGVRVVRSGTGRARQMNAGAAAARGRYILFLHADSRLPFGFAQAVVSVLEEQGVVAGAFSLAFDETCPTLRLFEKAANFRAKRRQMPYGDQGIFLTRETFESVGGYRDLAIMEDFDLIERLRKRGRVKTVDQAVITSARRYTLHGPWRVAFSHFAVRAGWRLGIAPERLARWRSALLGLSRMT